MGEVAAVELGRDSLVRDVKIRYKINTEDVGYTGCKNRYLKRSVHRIVVLMPVEEK